MVDRIAPTGFYIERSQSKDIEDGDMVWDAKDSDWVWPKLSDLGRPVKNYYAVARKIKEPA